MLRITNNSLVIAGPTDPKTMVTGSKMTVLALSITMGPRVMATKLTVEVKTKLVSPDKTAGSMVAMITLKLIGISTIEPVVAVGATEHKTQATISVETILLREAIGSIAPKIEETKSGVIADEPPKTFAPEEATTRVPGMVSTTALPSSTIGLETVVTKETNIGEIIMLLSIAEGSVPTINSVTGAGVETDHPTNGVGSTVTQTKPTTGLLETEDSSIVGFTVIDTNVPGAGVPI